MCIIFLPRAEIYDVQGTLLRQKNLPGFEGERLVVREHDGRASQPKYRCIIIS